MYFEQFKYYYYFLLVIDFFNFRVDFNFKFENKFALINFMKFVIKENQTIDLLFFHLLFVILYIIFDMQ